jgi:hypothetical protein
MVQLKFVIDLDTYTLIHAHWNECVEHCERPVELFLSVREHPVVEGDIISDLLLLPVSAFDDLFPR